MSSRRNSKDLPRVPLKHEGIQVNFCKNPQCANFGVAASTSKQPRGPGAKVRGADAYRISGKARGENITAPVLVCAKCGEQPPIKNNKGIYDEKARFLAYLNVEEPSCPNKECTNHGIGISQKKRRYHSHSEIASDSKRYRCLACRKTFTVRQNVKPTARHILPHKNSEVYNMLVNNVPMRRICKIAGIHPKVLYGKIRFIHRQTKAFVANRERRLLTGELPIEKLYLSVDRQDHTINWGRRNDKRQTTFHALGTADNDSSYVFAIHLNYDPSLRPEIVEAETIQNNDYLQHPPFREHARLWLQGDYTPAITIKAKELALRIDDEKKPLIAEIAETYDLLSVRKDVESFDSPALYTKFPAKGMQVHAEYTLYGHFFFLSEMLQHVKKIRFFLDQESGIRAACLAAFQERILERECDAFYVKINKRMTNDEKEKAMRDVRRSVEALGRELFGESYNPDDPNGPSFTSLRRILIERAIPNSRPLGPWRDMWVEVPSRIKSEPEKQVCHLTSFNDYDVDHLAALLDLTSLHGIDRFFAQIRHSLSLLGRATSSASNSGRRWFQKNPYNPEIAAMILDIFRVHYNYMEPGKDKKTPAMRLGLANAPIRLTDILNYEPSGS